MDGKWQKVLNVSLQWISLGGESVCLLLSVSVQVAEKELGESMGFCHLRSEEPIGGGS